MSESTVDLSKKTCCIVDNGLFCSLAETLAKDFGKVWYYSPILFGSDAKSNYARIGRGLPGVERVDDYWTLLGMVDLWVFPDIYYGPLQCVLERNLNQRVWGSRMGEELELDRESAKRHMAELGIPIGPWKSVRGMDALREYLKSHANQRVKRSYFRADMATFSAPKYDLIEPRLDELEYELGPAKNETDFVCEDSIDDAVEIGCDCYTVDGQWPTSGMWGLEVKSKMYVGAFCNYNKMPRQITECNRVLAPTLKKFRYRNWLALEMRITKDGTPFVIDPCSRAGNPPFALCQLMYTNMAQIMWAGAEGRLIDPIPADKYGCQIQMYSAWSAKNKLPVDYSQSISENVKLVNSTIINGRRIVIPTADESTAVGGIVASGPTLQAAIEKATEIAQRVGGLELEIMDDTDEAVEKEVERMELFGLLM